MKLEHLIFSTLMLLGALSIVSADDVDHFEGKPSPTLEAALINLSEYNEKLVILVNQDTLSPEDLHQIHELTYTLENALLRLGEEQKRLSELLENVHIASERADSNIVKSNSHAYLEDSSPLTENQSVHCE